jgi:hypothetical protein
MEKGAVSRGDTSNNRVPEPHGSGFGREEIMERKCEDCGVRAEGQYILDLDGVELCVLCALQLEENGDAQEAGGIAE